MRLRRVGSRLWRASLAPGTGDARHAFTEASSLIVSIADEDGHVGVGEASPRPGMSLETLAAVTAAFELLPESWDLEAAAALELAQPPSLRFALETARLDLLAQCLDQSLEAQLAGPLRERQATARLITNLASLEELALEPDRPLKLKLGRPGRAREELASLRRLRVRLGSQLELRVDANGAWSRTEWLGLAPQLAELELAFVEDPVSPEVWAELPQSPVPLAVDAPLSSADSATRARILGRADLAALVLKPTLLGGIAVARALAAEATHRNCVAIYSHLYEGPVGFSAIAAASLSDPAAVTAAGLGPHLGLADHLETIKRLDGTHLIPGAGPGLGAELR